MRNRTCFVKEPFSTPDPLFRDIIAKPIMDHLGEILPLWSVFPFVGMLLSIALFPLFAPRFWKRHFGKVCFLWAVLSALPMLIVFGGPALREFMRVLVAEYLPFIILLGALYTVSGGIVLKGTVAGTPVLNTIFLLLGAVLASWMGTTGAAMLLIRPFLRANAGRRHRTFMVVFFIFLVANIGGALTPLGDPPLFLGYLKGVPFFWTFRLLPHMVFISAILLVIYFIMDLYSYRKEERREDAGGKSISISGAQNFLFLAGIIGAAILSGSHHWRSFSFLGEERNLGEFLRDGSILLMGICSVLFTRRELRDENEFTWFPIKEVAIIFLALFITMSPCLQILQAGSRGRLAFLVNAIREPWQYFWITGALSSFLDNAPTYLSFLNTALGNFYPGLESRGALQILMRDHPSYLEAVSAGAVFFGAMTYIGNAPNFMVRSISEEAGTPMPGFMGYMIKYSLAILLPVYVLATFVFF